MVEPGNTEASEIRATEHAPIGSGLFLAHLAEDLSEATDLAQELPDVVAELTRRHEAWVAGLG